MRTQRLDVTMEKFTRIAVFAVASVVFLVVVIGAGVWLSTFLRAKQKYDEFRVELGGPFSEVQMNAEATSLLEEARSKWVLRYNDVNGPHSEALKILGMQPTVANLVALFTYPLPDYSWVRSARNVRASATGVIQAKIFPVSVDHAIHVSEGRDLAYIQISENIVVVFTDDTEGLREAGYTNLESLRQPTSEERQGVEAR